MNDYVRLIEQESSYQDFPDAGVLADVDYGASDGEGAPAAAGALRRVCTHAHARNNRHA